MTYCGRPTFCRGVEIFIDIHQHFSELIERPCPEVMVRLLKEI